MSSKPDWYDDEMRKVAEAARKDLPRFSEAIDAERQKLDDALFDLCDAIADAREKQDDYDASGQEDSNAPSKAVPMNDRKTQLLEGCREDNRFEPMDDGYLYFWTNNGALSASDLRIIADELDRLNADWDAAVKRANERAPDPLTLRGIIRNKEPKESDSDG